MLERESSREKNLEKSAKEAKAKARKEAARTAEPLDGATDEDLAQVRRGWSAIWGQGSVGTCGSGTTALVALAKNIHWLWSTHCTRSAAQLETAAGCISDVHLSLQSTVSCLFAAREGVL